MVRLRFDYGRTGYSDRSMDLSRGSLAVVINRNMTITEAWQYMSIRQVLFLCSA